MEDDNIIKTVFWTSLLVASIYYFFGNFYFERGRRRKIKIKGRKTKAIIIDYKTYVDSDGMRLYHPVYEFTKEDGDRIIVESDPSFARITKDSFNKSPIIFYLEDNPHMFFVEKSKPLELILLIIGVFITCLIMYAIFAIL